MKENYIKTHDKDKRLRVRAGVRDAHKTLYITLSKGVSLDKQEA